MIIDTHCHLEMKHFDKDRGEVIKRARNAGVKRMITVGTNLSDGEKVIQIAKANPDVFCAVGIHPHDSLEADEAGIAQLRELLKKPKVLALGEIGLDYFKNYAPRDTQVKAFEAQLDLAIELGMPLIIHDRDAHVEILEILKKKSRAPYRGVFHCFSGGIKTAREVLDLGFYISFTGTTTYKNETKSHEVLAMAPKERVMVETDCPYLAPVPFRGKRNEPSYVTYVGEKLAEIWGITPKQVARITTENAYRLFGFENADNKPDIC